MEGSSNTHGATLPKTETTLLLFVDVRGRSQSPRRKEAKSKRYESKLSTEKNLSNAKILKWGKKKRAISGVYTMTKFFCNPIEYKTHSHTHRHEQKYTPTWLQMGLGKASRSKWMRGTDREGEAETHTYTESSVEPGKISPGPNK